MNKSLPDKWIRKAVYDAINDISVLNPYTNENITIPCYDYRVTANGSKNHYILLTTQTNEVNQLTKCEDTWESTILVDVVTSFDATGNTGSRLLADVIMDAVRNACNNLTLDVSSGLSIQKQIFSFPNDISTITVNENIFRKLLRINLTIN